MSAIRGLPGLAALCRSRALLSPSLHSSFGLPSSVAVAAAFSTKTAAAAAPADASPSGNAAGVGGLLRSSAPRRLFAPAPLQSFHHDAKILDLPESGKAPRPFQGLDMRKVQDNPWVNVWVTRRKMETGYQWANYGGPSIHAPTMEEVASFFDCSNWKENYTWKEMAKAAYPQLRILLMFVGCILIPVTPCVGYMFYQQRLEPMEVTIPADEFFQHYRWHYYGPELDHHAFTAYLEARRAKRWRGLDVDPQRWIDPKYCNDDGSPEAKLAAGGGGAKHH